MEAAVMCNLRLTTKQLLLSLNGTAPLCQRRILPYYKPCSILRTHVPRKFSGTTATNRRYLSIKASVQEIETAPLSEDVPAKASFAAQEEYTNEQSALPDQTYPVDDPSYEQFRDRGDEGPPEKPAPGDKKLGAFQQLPMVAPAYELIGTALRKARQISPTKGIMNGAKRERNRGAKQLDALTKELAGPLGTYVRACPKKERFHDFEKSLLMLSLEDGQYERALERVDWLRKKVLDLGKNYASLVAKAGTRKEAEDLREEGFARVEELYKRGSAAVDELKEVVKVLRGMPVVDAKMPTLCLVGAPNVGKSSLVRILSSGKPEVCNYPFTTRGISMGHFFVNLQKFQVTDTPGLLCRDDEDRNKMELLTLAALTHLPSAVLFVHDLTAQCGTSVANQLRLYLELKSRFPSRPWLDAVSKVDLLPRPAPAETQGDLAELTLEEYRTRGPPGAIWVSTETEEGLAQLAEEVHLILSRHLEPVEDLKDGPFLRN